MEIGLTLIFANFMWANSLFFGLESYPALIGIMGLVLNVVPLNTAFTYLRRGGKIRSWKWFGVVFLALAPILPIPLYWEVVFFFAPLASLVIAIASIFLLRVSVGRTEQLEKAEVRGSPLRTGIVTTVCFLVVSLLLYLSILGFLQDKHDARSSILITSIFGLLYAALVFRNVRAKPAWSWSYVMQALVIASLLPISVWVNELIRRAQ